MTNPRMFGRKRNYFIYVRAYVESHCASPMLLKSDNFNSKSNSSQNKSTVFYVFDYKKNLKSFARHFDMEILLFTFSYICLIYIYCYLFHPAVEFLTTKNILQLKKYI